MNEDNVRTRENLGAIPLQSRDCLSSSTPSDLDRQDSLSLSWQRCAREHGLSPVGGSGPDILTQPELSQLRAPLDGTIAAAQEELDRLQSMIKPIGYATLLADPGGIIVERYCRDADALSFAEHGTRPGARWAEEAEGTNGIGTCVIEQRPLSVHRQQHFRRRYANLSCSGAPIFDIDGRLKAVLNVVSYATEISDRSHVLALALAIESARAIEEREFRECWRGNWIFALQTGNDGGHGALLAVDDGHRILAADHHARSAFDLDAARIGDGISLRQVFERHPLLCKKRNAEDLVIATVQNDGTHWHGLATPPDAGLNAWRSGPQAMVHTRPRLARLGNLQRQRPADTPHGGLPPRALCRVRQYIESNLGKPIQVEDLAQVAELSSTHFARAFKKSLGVTPHCYLTRQRVDKAAQLLSECEQSLAEIAQTVGFCDQSHFTRSFIRLTGSTPSAYRRARH